MADPAIVDNADIVALYQLIFSLSKILYGHFNRLFQQDITVVIGLLSDFTARFATATTRE